MKNSNSTEIKEGTIWERIETRGDDSFNYIMITQVYHNDITGYTNIQYEWVENPEMGRRWTSPVTLLNGFRPQKGFV